MNTTVKKSRGLLGWLSPVAFILTYFLARVAMETERIGGGLKIVVAFVPVIPFGWMLFEMVRHIRTLDELERRIQVESLAKAFLIVLMLLMTLGLLEIGVKLPPEDLSYRHVWAFLPVIYFACMYLTRRNYQ